MRIKKIKVGKHDKEAIKNLIWFHDRFKKQKEEEKNLPQEEKLKDI